MSDETPAVAQTATPKEVEKVSGQDGPLSQEEFEAQIKDLTERARAAGLNPLHPIAKTYLRQGIRALEGFLESLESADSSKKKA